MSKVITSPVKRFSGTVTLQDPLYYPQDMAMREALAAAKALGQEATLLEYNHAMLAGILKCVEECNLKDVLPHPTADTFPTTPGESATRLTAWLIAEVVKLYQEGDEIPNA